MVDVTMDIDQAAVAKLDALLSRVAADAPRRLATETRRVALYICQALKSRTVVAPRRARANEVQAMPSPVPPRYVHSNSAGHPLLRRWQLTRKVGTPDAYTKHHFVYTAAHRAKGGKMVGKNQSKERAELLRLHAGISRRGLAKKSWGWIAKGIYGGTSDDLSWKKTRGERRDPRNYVRGMFQKSTSGAFAAIENHLDYALDALKPGAMSDAINAATKRLEYNIAADLMRAENAPAAVHRSAYQNWVAHTKGWW